MTENTVIQRNKTIKGRCEGMPFLKDTSVIQKSLYKTKKYSLLEKTPITRRLFFPDRISAPACKKGIPSHLRYASLTVEAAMIIPIFFMAVICIVGIMGIYPKTLESMASLRDKAELAASAAVGDEEIWITIPETMEFRPIFLPSGIGAAKVYCVGSARGWTGRDESSFADLSDNAPRYVYVTENGVVYHTHSSCSHINLSISRVNSSELSGLRNENREKYKACESCAKGGAANTIYITDYGDRYHNSASCSKLKRSVKLVDVSKLSGMRECSKCMSEAS